MNMIMSTSFKIVVLLLLWFLYAVVSNFGLCHGNYPEVVCNEKDKQVLVSFKQGLSDPSNRLSSWSVHEDCCRWTGVRCNNVTGRVVELHLRNPYYGTTDQYRPFRLHGKIPVLPKLEFLSHLDLSGNSFYGMIPHQLGNLTNLRYIDLGLNFGLYANSLSWVARLHSLEYLDMSRLNLHRAADWLQAVSMLPSLSKLVLFDCQLEKTIPPLGYVNFTSLEVLSLIENHFNSEIPNWLFNVSSLVSVGLSLNSFYGHIPCNLVNLRMLKHLQLAGNILSGNIPDCLGQMKHLELLSLGGNSLDGSIPESLGNLSSLTILHLSFNRLNGTVPKSIGFLSNLERLSIKKNSLAGIFKIQRMPEKMGGMTMLESLDLSKHVKIRHALRNFTRKMFLNLSHNHLIERIPEKIGGMTMLESLGLSRNHLSGEIPQSMSNLTFLSYLNLSYNNFSGRIPSDTQFQSFDTTSYAGNVELCGAPLSKNCTREEKSHQGATPVDKDGDEDEMSWFYNSMGIGFAVGFWTVCGALFFKRTWRYAYFQFVDNMIGWVYVTIRVKVNWFRRRFKSEN